MEITKKVKKNNVKNTDMSQKKAIIVEESKKEVVLSFLKNHQIKFEEVKFEEVAAPKNKKPAEFSHHNMLKYAQQLGYENIPLAIFKVGNGKLFRKQFLESLEK